MENTGMMANAAAATPPVLSNSDFRILLIDDNADANESMACLLEILGYGVRMARDAATGLQATAEFSPHLVLSDIGLPDMSGLQLAPKLRAAAGERRMVLAAATGYGFESDVLRMREAGFDFHFVKPLDAEMLINFVAEQRDLALGPASPPTGADQNRPS
jgi:DNA-binding response OmpR family regulator